MKKLLYLLAGGMFLVSTSVNAQSSKSANTVKKSADVSATNTIKPQTRVQAKDLGEPIWEDTFENLDNWTVSNESTPAVDWIHTTDADIIPYGPLRPFMSETVENGFAYVDGDGQGEGSVQNSNLTLANSVDLSEIDNVSVNFQQNTRNFQTTYTLRVSPDNGATWIDIPVNPDVDTNENTDNPELTSINVSEYLAGSSEALIEFNFTANWGWHWAIDDVGFYETPENDLSLNGVHYDEYVEYLPLEEFLDTDYLPEVEHSSYKQDQVRPLSFIAEVSNQGVNVQTGVVLTAEITTPDGMESVSSDPVDIEAGVATLIKIEDVMLDAFSGGEGSIGNYSVEFSIGWDQADDDQILGNNEPMSKSFTVNDEYMATDLGTDWATYYPTLGEDVIWGTRMMFEQETTINYIQFGILSTDDAPSQPGDVVYLNMRTGSVLETEGGENPMNRLYGDDEIEYVLTEAEFTTGEQTIWITMPLPEEVTVSPGVVYQGEVEIPVIGEDYLWVPFSNQQSSFVGVLFEYAEQSGGPQGWWTLGGNVPHIRLGYNESLGVDGPSDLTFKLGQNYPNPTTGATRIDWELLEPANDVQFRITDINGRLVYQEDLGNRPAGVQESLDLNLDLAAGNYQYALQVGNEVIVRKMVVTK
ncbi:MAG: T9SS type A sorting domain-containing protein [Cryomorphaceae bacterium]|nr:T9SS type A sorting domain-containing protein [Flavobacteriales bacterium]